MEKLVLHADSSYLAGVDSFVRDICDTNHIGNYYATISVPVTEAVNRAMTCGNAESQPMEVILFCDYCPQGILFSVQGRQGCFQNDDFSLIRMLADQVELSDDCSSMRMTFAVRGIDCGEAAQRISVLQRFYHPISAAMLQM